MRRSIEPFVLILVLFLAIPLPLTALDDPGDETVTEEQPIPYWSFDLNGYVKNLASTQTIESQSVIGESTRINSDLSRFRLSPEIMSADQDYIFHMDLDNELIFGSGMKTGEFELLYRPSHFNELAQPYWNPVYNDHVLYRIKIHRLYAKITKDRFTLTAGRQLVRFGSGRLWNPLDIMNPVSPVAIEGAEELTGTDAVRVQYYPLDMMELSLVLNQSRYDDNLDEMTVKDTNSLLRMKLSTGNLDIAAIGGWIARRGIGGMDGAYVLLDGMARASLLYSNPVSGQYFIQSAAGYEYTFKSGVTLLAEYFYNGAAVRFNSDIEDALADRKLYGTRQQNYHILASQFITMNRHYTGIGAGYDFLPLLHGDLYCIWDIEGRGVIALPSLTYNIFQNVDIALTLITGLSADSGRSDFDIYDRTCSAYGSAVWYF